MQERANAFGEKVATSDKEMSSSISERLCMVGAIHLWSATVRMRVFEPLLLVFRESKARYIRRIASMT